MNRILVHALPPGKRLQDPQGGPEGPGEGKHPGDDDGRSGEAHSRLDQGS